MLINGFNKTLLSIMLLSGLGCSISLQALAAEQCKGLEKPTCQESPECVWVSSYTTKQGNTVSAYCRSSGKAARGVNPKEGVRRESGTDDRNKPSAATPATTSEENRG